MVRAILSKVFRFEALYIAIPLVTYTFAWLVFNPGFPLYDTIQEATQGNDLRPFNDQHPLIITLIIRALVKNIGWQAVSLMQCFGTIFAISITAFLFQDLGMKRKFAITLVALLSLEPHFLEITAGVISPKDVLAMSMSLALFACIIYIVKIPADRKPTKSFWILFILIALAFSLSRFGLFYIFAAASAVCLIANRNFLKPVLISIAIVFASSFSINTSLTVWLKPYEVSSAEILSVPLQMTGGILNSDNLIISDEQMQYFESVIPEESWGDFNPILSDPFKMPLMYDREWTAGDSIEFAFEAAKLCARNFSVCVQTYANFEAPYFISTKNLRPLSNIVRDGIPNIYLIKERMCNDEMYSDGYDIQQCFHLHSDHISRAQWDRLIAPAVADYSSGFYAVNSFSPALAISINRFNVAFSWLPLTFWFYFLFIIVCFILCKKSILIPLCIPILIFTSLLAFGPDAEFRYIYSMMFILPAAIASIVFFRKPNNN